MTKPDIYNVNGRINAGISKIEEANITERNRKLILDFINYSLARG